MSRAVERDSGVLPPPHPGRPAPYPEYRDSGVEWLGRVPAHWNVVRLRHVAEVRSGVAKGRKFDDVATVMLPYLRVANVQDGYIDLTDVAEIEVAEHEIDRFSLRRGDVLMNEGGDFDKLGRGAVWDGPIAPCLHQNHVFAVRAGIRLSPEWLSMVTQAAYLKHFFILRSKQSTNLASISSSNIKEAPILLPPMDEQHRILGYLDRRFVHIDRLVEKKQMLIELLREKRQAVITRAVTRGLDPAVDMTDSGAEWIGLFPVHWELLPLRHVAEVRSGVAKGRRFGDTPTVTLPYLRVANVQDGYIDLSDVAKIEVARHEVQRFSLRRGDVLMNEGGDFDKLGRGAVWDGSINPCLHQNHVFAVRAGERSSPEWLSMATQSAYLKHFFILRSKQSTNLASISSSNLKEAPILVPPREDQDLILDHLDRETTRIDALIAKIEEHLALLGEHRQALIAAAVTGQIDVRNEVLA